MQKRTVSRDTLFFGGCGNRTGGGRSGVSSGVFCDIIESMKGKIYVAVVSGGPSSEYEVSLKSGDMVAEGLDKERYEPIPVRVSRGGEWELAPESVKKNASCAFIAMHGAYGEDGTIQRIFESHDIPYTGSDALASALGMNKFLSLRLFRDAGLLVPATLLLTRSEWRKDHRSARERAERMIGYPLVVKPNNQGSSVGVFIARNGGELDDALAETLGFYREVLVQEFIEGREFTCGTLDHGFPESAFPLLPTEIIPRVSSFFDYRAKYEAEGSYEVTPPENLSGETMKTIRSAAVFAHRIIGASGFSRTDMIMDGKKNIYILEINTIPGLTRESLIPKAALAGGMTFSKLLDTIIRAGLNRRGRAPW